MGSTGLPGQPAEYPALRGIFIYGLAGPPQSDGHHSRLNEV